jgi:mRNA-degrading endonuclease YafQ of YafQ-DinJ toxin-antitoxin module
MYELELSNLFKKDLKLAKKRGLKLEFLDIVVTQLVENGKIEKYVNNQNYKNLDKSTLLKIFGSLCFRWFRAL